MTDAPRNVGEAEREAAGEQLLRDRQDVSVAKALLEKRGDDGPVKYPLDTLQEYWNRALTSHLLAVVLEECRRSLPARAYRDIPLRRRRRRGCVNGRRIRGSRGIG